MIEDQLNEALITEIRKRFPKNSGLVNTLTDILFIEKEAVYRRLRREVPFTFKEVVLIAKNLGVSLDSIVGIQTQKSRPFQLKLPEFISPQENDFYMLNTYFDFLTTLGQMENTEMGLVTNVLPQDLFLGFHSLAKFNVFHWNYHCNNGNVKTFHDLVIPEKVLDGFRTQFIESKNISTTRYIFDNQVFQHFINTINYFSSIKLIEREDVLKVKEELFQIIDYLENISITGKFKETGNPVFLYISDIDITTNYCYMEAGSTKFSMIKTFLLTSVTSTDEHTFEKMKKWIHSFIKISTLITIAGEKQRILYFEAQRKIVNEL
jgi:hypothetical protein